MLFKLLHISKNWNEAIDYEADSIEAACEYVLKNSFKFSNYRLLLSDTVQVCYKTIDGDWFIAAFVDLHKNEIWIQHYHWDDRRPPEPYVENASDDSEEKTAEQGEPVDVENTSASEQGNTVEKSSSKCFDVSFEITISENPSVSFYHHFRVPNEIMADVISSALSYGFSRLKSSKQVLSSHIRINNSKVGIFTYSSK